VADSIRVFPDYYCAQHKDSREIWITRLTQVALAIAAIQLIVLAYSLITADVEPVANPPVTSQTAPYIPPKPSFFSQEP